MATLSYDFRPGIWNKDRTFTLGDGVLTVAGRPPIPFADIRQIRTYEQPPAPMVTGMKVPGKRCDIYLHHGRSVFLSTSHVLGWQGYEDRASTYDPFVDSLIRQVAASNTDTVFVSGMPFGLWLTWVFVIGMAALIGPICVIAMIALIASGKGFDGAMAYPVFILLSLVFGIRPLIRTLRRDWPRRYDPRVAAPA